MSGLNRNTIHRLFHARMNLTVIITIMCSFISSVFFILKFTDNIYTIQTFNYILYPATYRVLQLYHLRRVQKGCINTQERES